MSKREESSPFFSHRSRTQYTNHHVSVYGIARRRRGGISGYGWTEGLEGGALVLPFLLIAFFPCPVTTEHWRGRTSPDAIDSYLRNLRKSPAIIYDDTSSRQLCRQNLRLWSHTLGSAGWLAAWLGRLPFFFPPCLRVLFSRVLHQHKDTCLHGRLLN